MKNEPDCFDCVKIGKLAMSSYALFKYPTGEEFLLSFPTRCLRNSVTKIIGARGAYTAEPYTVKQAKELAKTHTFGVEDPVWDKCTWTRVRLTSKGK